MAGWTPLREKRAYRQAKKREAAETRPAGAHSPVSPEATEAWLDTLLAELGRLLALQEEIDREIDARLESDARVRAEPQPGGEQHAAGAEESRARQASSRQLSRPPAQTMQGDKTAFFPKLPSRPAVPISKSVTTDAIICLIDGEPRKMLHRHLKTRYGITPEQYRAHFGLPDDYPMTAPGYSRSQSRAISNAIREGRAIAPSLKPRRKAAGAKRKNADV